MTESPDKQPSRILGISTVFHNGWLDAGQYDLLLLASGESIERIEYSARQGFYYAYNPQGALVGGEHLPANTRIAIYEKPPVAKPSTAQNQTLAHLKELAANPETRGELRALIINLFPELFGEL